RAQSLGVGGIASLLTGRPLAVEVIDNLQSSLSLWRAGKIFAYTDVFFSENVKDKVSLVGSGFNTAIFRPAETRKEFDICYCGSFKEWDGIEDLVEAIELLKNKNKKKRDGKTPKVLMIGKGARFANVREMVNKKGMGENFTFTGNVPLKTVPALINSASLCVAPFNVRGYMKGEFGRYGYYFAPLKVLEYMACGKPVVATNYEIIAGVLQKKEQLFAEGNAAELARKLEALLADKKLQGELGSYNLQESKKHTWGKVAEHMNSEMEALI
ncbi:glycosyltransferase family 4 protein, partial [Candidatus Micrarchaeota archaeon]|nr:glycosyltransferase family 4 protein [Candidatus Micrarchaeota archaeon]